tara:strand:+ start:441 stop:689 length:249 start_codon:yes stop_codon:yes gene_type:complete
LEGPGYPEDVANLVLFLVSDGSRFITSQIINIDGGVAAKILGCQQRPDLVSGKPILLSPDSDYLARNVNLASRTRGSLSIRS